MDGFKMENKIPARQKYQLEVAGTIAQRLRVWSLVYHDYRDKNFIPENDDELYYSVYDALPHTTSFLITCDGADVGTLTVIFDSPLGLPADEIYHEELDDLRRQGRRLAEIVSLVNQIGNPREGLEVLWRLFQLSSILYALIMNYNDCVITVHPHHQHFYEKILLFQQIGSLKACPKVSDAPAVLLNLTLDKVINGFHGVYGKRGQEFYQSMFNEESKILQDSIIRQRQPLSYRDFHRYFLNRSQIFKKGPATSSILSLYYPEFQSELSGFEPGDDYHSFNFDAVL
jgi:hypothetical protein